MEDFEGLCRLCLKPSKERMVLLSHLDDLVLLLARVKLVKHPSIPHRVCQTCSGILLAAGMLRVNCVESNKYFLEYLSSKNQRPLSPEEAEEWDTDLEIAEMQELTAQNEPEKEEIEESEAVVVFEDEESFEMEVVEPPRKRTKARSEAESCRLCLGSFKELPEENSELLMREMIQKILTLKKFPSSGVSDKFCDDCFGKFLTASSVADKCRAAYEYFHSEESVIITTATCWVCLKDFQSDSEICDMSSMTYSYMHYLAIRNIAKDLPELDGERRICLRCMHDLEVANSIRYKNWKTESLLDSKYGKPSLLRSAASKSFDPWYDKVGGKDFPRPLNSSPATPQAVDCQYCLNQFPSESCLRKHIDRDHIPEGSTQCEHCGTKLANERSLKVHYLSVHMKFIEGICDICGRLYHSVNKLLQHRVIHFEERNVPCTKCPMTFKRKENLKIHMRTHTGEKPFKCPFCEKKYAHHSDCKRHIVTHTGKYPVECPTCGQGFMKKTELDVHLEKHSSVKEETVLT